MIIKKCMRKMTNAKTVWMGSLLFGMFGTMACADSEHPGNEETAVKPVVKARVAGYDQLADTVDGEDKVEHIQACQFIGGTLAKVYDDLAFDGSAFNLQLTDYEGTLYVIANTEGMIDLNALHDRRITEDEWKQTVLNLKEGKKVHFFSGSLSLDSFDESQTELSLSMKRGMARFDIDLQTADTASVESLTLKNVARSVYLFANPDAHSPTGVERKDTTVVFSRPLTANTSGVLYVYEQANEGLEVSVTAVIDGERKTLTKVLSEPVIRNTVNKIIVRKDYISVNLNVSFDEWEPGNDTELEAKHAS